MLWGGRLKLNIMRVYGNQNGQNQEPMNRSMQLHYNPVTAFSKMGLFLDRIFTVSIPITRNLLTSLHHWTRTAVVWELHYSYSSAPDKIKWKKKSEELLIKINTSLSCYFISMPFDFCAPLNLPLGL